MYVSRDQFAIDFSSKKKKKREFYKIESKYTFLILLYTWIKRNVI